MKKVLTAVLCMILAACSSRESAQFAPPRFVSATSEVTGRNAVTLHCTLSDGRVESCGILYGRDGKLNKRVDCDLNEDSFDITISELADDVIYTWCAFATAGKAEIQSSPGTFRTSKRDPVPVEDPAFLNYLLQNHDYDRDGVFGYGDAENVRHIRITPTEDYNLQSLQGIEYMPELEEIECIGGWSDESRVSPPSANHYYVGPYTCWDYWGPIGTLRHLDVSGNPRLKILSVNNNSGLGVGPGCIDLTHNPELEYLEIGMTWMSYPDISKNKALKYVGMTHLRGALPDLSALCKVRLLGIDFPQDSVIEYVDLDVSNMPELEHLNVNNRIRSLSDLSANPRLQRLYIEYNKLESLELGANTQMRELSCCNNRIKTLDVSRMSVLQFFDCSPMTGESGENTLETLYVAHGQLIPNVTVGRSSDYIPDATKIIEH